MQYKKLNSLSSRIVKKKSFARNILRLRRHNTAILPFASWLPFHQIFITFKHSKTNLISNNVKKRTPQYNYAADQLTQ